MENLFGRLLTQQELGPDMSLLPQDVTQFAGMAITGKNVICKRCGTASSCQTVRLEISAYFCPECLQLGRIRSDEFLYHLPQQPFPRKDALLWTGTLTPYQADISKDRKSTRLNSSHHSTSYAVFCLK